MKSQWRPSWSPRGAAPTARTASGSSSPTSPASGAQASTSAPSGRFDWVSIILEVADVLGQIILVHQKSQAGYHLVMHESARELFLWSQSHGCVNPVFSCRCRDIALKCYHRYECGVAAFLDASGLGPVPLLALRTIARFGKLSSLVAVCKLYVRSV